MQGVRRTRGRGSATMWCAVCLLVVWYGLARSALGGSGPQRTDDTGVDAGEITQVVEKGKCYYEVTGPVCVEAQRVVAFRASADIDGEVLPLCTGFPQRKPEGSEMIINKRKQSWEDTASAFTPHQAVTLAPTTDTAYFVMLTLETNLFHVIRDTIANVADMMSQSSRGYPASPSRVFLVPKNPAFHKVDNRFYHPLLAGIVGGGPHEWSQRNLIVTTADVDQGTRMCAHHGFIGQPFKGYTNGPAGRLQPYKGRVYRSFGLEQEAALTNKVTIIERGDSDGDVNRKVGNLEAIVGILEELGFAAEVVRFHKKTLSEQLALAKQSSMLLGSHGQALSWCTFLPANGVCFELGLWRDARPDYKLLSKWSDVVSIFIPLPNPSQVVFPLQPDMSDSDKSSINYYKPYSNYVHRQKQVIYPDIDLVKSELERAKEMLVAKGMKI